MFFLKVYHHDVETIIKLNFHRYWNINKLFFSCDLHQQYNYQHTLATLT
jgi:hypothetical protein